ncbi:MAG: hypothetical protein K9N34_09005 [Candidatus Marinimicrobia bacterium]|nr:hypothetical protein [Candidatus Neomarinimicrobiota bacterium]MCF7840062.1 hypothetical protein [Candidatus Neomarinimicrobiota bacterium]MCF7902422.1 hypothetical protein [Candidatus Neomarinimicrobiota bacterium]
METAKRDVLFARIAVLGILAILLPWIWDGLVWLWDWYVGYAESEANFWQDVWRGFLTNFSIILIVYTIICLQVAGVAEFKLKRHFLPAFLLALILTPPGMMAAYGHRRNAAP